MIRSRVLSLMSAVACTLSIGAQASGQNKHWDELRNLPFPENYPTRESADRLHDEVQFQRACQVVNWSLPAMALTGTTPMETVRGISLSRSESAAIC